MKDKRYKVFFSFKNYLKSLFKELRSFQGGLGCSINVIKHSVPFLLLIAPVNMMLNISEGTAVLISNYLHL